MNTEIETMCPTQIMTPLLDIPGYPENAIIGMFTKEFTLQTSPFVFCWEGKISNVTGVFRAFDLIRGQYLEEDTTFKSIRDLNVLSSDSNLELITESLEHSSLMAIREVSEIGFMGITSRECFYKFVAEATLGI